MKAEIDMGSARKTIRRVLVASSLLFMTVFVGVWLSWALFPAIAIVGFMLIAWFLGAVFAIAVVPANVYQKYVEQYDKEISQKP